MQSPLIRESMAFTQFDQAMVEVRVEEFLERRRPPVHLRDKADLGYRIEGQSVILFEIRPVFRRPEEKIKIPVAKTTFVKKNGSWNVLWRRSDQKWHSYEPVPEADSLDTFLELVDQDEYGCFWG